MAINNLLASPGFAAWLNGEPLDIQRLLFTAAGKPRIAVISIAHLSDAERMFIVTLLLNEVDRVDAQPVRHVVVCARSSTWTRSSATSRRPRIRRRSSRCSRCSSRARAFGLGCVLATQNPVDLDYKGLVECRHLDDRPAADRARQAARARRTGERRARLGPCRAGQDDLRPDAARVPDAQRPRRCARAVSKSLGTVVSARPADRRGDFEAHGAASKHAGRAASSPSLPSAASGGERVGASRDQTSRADVPEYFLAATAAGDALLYKPMVMGSVKLHFVDAKLALDQWQTTAYLAPLADDGGEVLWNEATNIPDLKSRLGKAPAPSSDVRAAAGRCVARAVLCDVGQGVVGVLVRKRSQRSTRVRCIESDLAAGYERGRLPCATRARRA